MERLQFGVELQSSFGVPVKLPYITVGHSGVPVKLLYTQWNTAEYCNMEKMQSSIRVPVQLLYYTMMHSRADCNLE